MDKYKIVLTIAKLFNMEYDTLLHGKYPEQVYFARYIAVMILREERLPTQEIMKVFTNKSRGYFDGHCMRCFRDLIAHNRVFKDMYLRAVKAIEDLEDESKNDTDAA